MGGGHGVLYLHRRVEHWAGMGGESYQNSTIRSYFFVGLEGPFFTHVSSSGEACLIEWRGVSLCEEEARLIK